MRRVRRVEVDRWAFHARKHMRHLRAAMPEVPPVTTIFLTAAHLRHQRLPERFSQMLPQTAVHHIELKYAGGLRPSRSCVLRINWRYFI